VITRTLFDDVGTLMNEAQIEARALARAQVGSELSGGVPRASRLRLGGREGNEKHCRRRLFWEIKIKERCFCGRNEPPWRTRSTPSYIA
jgi:hypothetical protein